VPPSGFPQPHPYCCWLNPHFDTALFISAATVATLDVSLPSPLPHSSLQPMLCYISAATVATLDVSLHSSLPHFSLHPMLCYLLSATYAFQSLRCCHYSLATALLALLLCLICAALWLFSAPSLLLLFESAFRYRALQLCRNCRYAGCEPALFFAALFFLTFALVPTLCYLSPSAFMLLPPISRCCAAGATVMPLRCNLLAFLSPILIAAG
jgi:hypothetical protein